MTELLIRLFVRDYRNTDQPQVRERYGKFSGIVGIVSNLLLFAMKAITGLVTGSISIIADAVNNLSDSASSVITLVGFKLSGKPADKNVKPVSSSRAVGEDLAYEMPAYSLSVFRISSDSSNNR